MRLIQGHLGSGVILFYFLWVEKEIINIMDGKYENTSCHTFMLFSF